MAIDGWNWLLLQFLDAVATIDVLIFCIANNNGINLVKTWTVHFEPGGGGGGAILGLIFAGYAPLVMRRWPVRTPTSFLSILWSYYRPHLSHFWENEIFAIST